VFDLIENNDEFCEVSYQCGFTESCADHSRCQKRSWTS
jgi:hypothetical protein